MAPARKISTGYTKPKIELKELTKKHQIFGRYDEKTNTILIDPKYRAFPDDLPQTAQVALHEAAHAYQRKLVVGLYRGKITPADPAFAAAQLFAINTEAYFDPDKYGKEYRMQPIEFHGRSMGAAAYTFLFEKLHRDILGLPKPK